MTELEEWQLYFRMKNEEHTKEDYYAAMIARTVSQTNGGKAPLDAFLLKFKEPKPAKKVHTPEDVEAHQSFWMGLVGCGDPASQELQYGEQI
jgi:hypothetical protein